MSTEQQAMFSLQTSMLQLEKAQAANDPAASLMTQAELYERNNALIQKNIDLLNSQIKALEALPASVSNDEAITRMQIQIEGLRGSIRTVSDDIRDSIGAAIDCEPDLFLQVAHRSAELPVDVDSSTTSI